MSGKPRCTKTVQVQVRQGPDGTVKPKLVEPKYPNCKTAGWTSWSIPIHGNRTRQELEGFTRGLPDPKGNG